MKLFLIYIRNFFLSLCCTWRSKIVDSTSVVTDLLSPDDRCTDGSHKLNVQSHQWYAWITLRPKLHIRCWKQSTRQVWAFHCIYWSLKNGFATLLKWQTQLLWKKNSARVWYRTLYHTPWITPMYFIASRFEHLESVVQRTCNGDYIPIPDRGWENAFYSQRFLCGEPSAGIGTRAVTENRGE